MGVISFLLLLFYIGSIIGYNKILVLYFGPLCIINSWFITYSFLHHTDPKIPWYGENEWTWLKGALSTIDRKYPILIDLIHHHGGSAHICHHLFPEIPHYHLIEATKYIKNVLGSKYNYDDNFFIYSLWNNMKHCNYIEQDIGIQYYQSNKMK